MKKAAPLIILIVSLASVCAGQESTSELGCDFSDYAPLIKSHIVAWPEPRYAYVEKRVQPQYPAIARAARAQGAVKINILIDPRGNVVEACAAEGHPLLRVAGMKAALGWKFKRFPGKSKFKRQHLQSQITFYFSLG